jgi:hypothetical protein
MDWRLRLFDKGFVDNCLGGAGDARMDDCPYAGTRRPDIAGRSCPGIAGRSRSVEGRFVTTEMRRFDRQGHRPGK